MKDSLTKRGVEAFAREKRRFRTRCFQIKILPSTQPYPRIAFVFSRKSGNAVLRNRFKRRLRDLMRRNAAEFSGMDLLFLPLKPFGHIDDVLWQAERDDIIALCRKQKPPRPVAP